MFTGEVRDDGAALFEVMRLQPGKVQKPKISQIVLADLMKTICYFIVQDCMQHEKKDIMGKRVMAKKKKL